MLIIGAFDHLQHLYEFLMLMLASDSVILASLARVQMLFAPGSVHEDILFGPFDGRTMRIKNDTLHDTILSATADNCEDAWLSIQERTISSPLHSR